MANPYESIGYAGSQPAPAPQAGNPYAAFGHADDKPSFEEAAKKISELDPITQYIADSTPFKIAQTACLLYTSPSPRDRTRSRMPSSA